MNQRHVEESARRRSLLLPQAICDRLMSAIAREQKLLDRAGAHYTATTHGTIIRLIYLGLDADEASR